MVDGSRFSPELLPGAAAVEATFNVDETDIPTPSGFEIYDGPGEEPIYASVKRVLSRSLHLANQVNHQDDSHNNQRQDKDETERNNNSETQTATTSDTVNNDTKVQNNSDKDTASDDEQTVANGYTCDGFEEDLYDDDEVRNSDTAGYGKLEINDEDYVDDVDTAPLL